MTGEKKKLTELEIREMFRKYDVNNDNSIDHKELTKMVSDIYLQSHNMKELSEKDLSIIKRSVDELFKLKDSSKDGTLQIDEFMSHFNGQDIFEHTGKSFYNCY